MKDLRAAGYSGRTDSFWYLDTGAAPVLADRGLLCGLWGNLVDRQEIQGTLCG